MVGGGGALRLTWLLWRLARVISLRVDTAQLMRAALLSGSHSPGTAMVDTWGRDTV